MNDEEALDKFVRGLHPTIRGNVLAARPVDVDDACNIALAYASGLHLGQQNNYAPVPQPYQQTYQQPYQQQYSGPEPMDLDAIQGCRNNYRSRPPQKRNVATCHWCGEVGHFKRNCRDRLAAIRQLDEARSKKQGFRETQP
ncbi:CCHC-type zinc finger transcription factor [Phycomyces blakesleeanus NRRL 1555(-)]|uniref:CCHC-type zinc finger transcription factor n=1 Tax=Phycomyces blakesleeanus (strain ATCC 8743b / DSM 1359 / FGSC 10004 / NBRC 33097 / NRRL 1555) TaxID=763407 RepID=A0A167QBU6_PHYB8|nr:CCHC-type zinc finger transcription factor [Phycomyces blakesleeanus NRRL 1555(-)]OAD79444.1 CCHC-type zinc finger transcription factor [Phycomyces blakesleeanus NRRL 1555(-)]|eukprot:XP_018297484.1 CCHC-type zinc finger transcription factor [Phycomyces blakesleeanus NRRL 1555(-)]